MTEAAVLRVVLSLTLIVIAILALAWLARRTGWIQGNAAHRLKVISSQRLEIGEPQPENRIRLEKL